MNLSKGFLPFLKRFSEPSLKILLTSMCRLQWKQSDPVLGRVTDTKTKQDQNSQRWETAVGIVALYIRSIVPGYRCCSTWSRVLVKLTVAYPVRKLLTSYSTTWKFITNVYPFPHCPLSWAIWIQFLSSQYISLTSISHYSPIDT